MKIEMPASVAKPPTPGSAPAPESARRWLAQLEGAFIGQLAGDRQDAGGPAGDDQGSSSSPDDAGGADSTAGEGRSAPTPPAQASGQGLGVPVAVLATAGMPAPPAACALPSDHPYAGLAQAAVGQEPEPAQPTQPARVPTVAARPIGTRTQPVMAHGAPARGETAAPPPRYARQFMQLALGDSPEASVRDAALDDAAGAAVAHAVASRLRGDGIALQRVFVNGRRFDFDPAATPAATQDSPPPGHEQEHTPT
jgi:hypothetical protein